MNKFRKKIQKFHREFDGFIGSLFSPKKDLGKICKGIDHHTDFDIRDNFTFSKQNHFETFDLLPIHKTQNITTCDLKVYQDLFIYSYIRENIPEGSKILEIGGGDSRIINALKGRYECWNLDRLEGAGYGPKGLISDSGFTMVKDEIGGHSQHLPDQYFDLVFSISVVEHFPEEEPLLLNIYSDMHRVLKEGATSLHCIDSLMTSNSIWIHPFIYLIEDKIGKFNIENMIKQIKSDNMLWVLPKYAYYTRWFPITKKCLRRFGTPFSINIFWQNNQ